MKKILVTGASGFVGSFLVEECLRRNLSVYAGIRRTSSREFLSDQRINTIELDFSDVDGLRQILQRGKFDYIIHNAGVTGAPRIEDYWRVNFEYVKNLVDAVRDIPLKKFTFISSLAAYGPANQYDLSDYLKDGDTPNPINTYGATKLASEKYISALPDFPWIFIRPTGIIGPRDKEFLTFFKVLDWHLEPYIGFRRQHLSFVYVKDLVRVVLDATLSSEGQKGYFVSDGKHYAQHDLGRTAKKVLKTWTLSIHIPLSIVRLVAWIAEKTVGRNGRFPTLNMEKVKILESRNWKCDIEPLKEDFNFNPQYTLEEGLRETIAWYRDNGWM